MLFYQGISCVFILEFLLDWVVEDASFGHGFFKFTVIQNPANTKYFCVPQHSNAITTFIHPPSTVPSIVFSSCVLPDHYFPSISPIAPLPFPTLDLACWEELTSKSGMQGKVHITTPRRLARKYKCPAKIFFSKSLSFSLGRMTISPDFPKSISQVSPSHDHLRHLMMPVASF